MVGVGILRGMQRHWLSVVAYHLGVKSDGGNQPVLMTMEGELQFPSETRMQIWGYVNASVLNFPSTRDESRFKGYEQKASNNESLGRVAVNLKVEGLRRRGFSPGLHLTQAGGEGARVPRIGSREWWVLVLSGGGRFFQKVIGGTHKQ